MIDPLFKQLVDVPSVSGNENLFQKLVENEVGSITSTNAEDVLGNFTATIGSGDKKVLITAHADEVGFIVTYISDDGFIYFQPVGGIEADVAVGQVVTVQTKIGPVAGIIGRFEVWETASSEDSDEITPFKKLWVDIGTNKNVRDIVTIGDRIYYNTTIYELPGSFVLARGGDDKLGVFIVIKTAQEFAKSVNPNLSMSIAMTAQEEVGSRGVQAVVSHLQPEYSIVIDTIAATDVPIADSEELGQIRLGGGPTISRGSNTNNELFSIFTHIADTEKIPYQIEAEPGPTATDGDQFQTAGAGSATIIIGVPVRYTHFPAQVICWEDVENCVKLVESVLKQL
jgi:endoglucanase